MDASGSLQRQTDVCPDCIIRDDVDLLGRVRRGRYLSVRRCMGCRGTTRVPKEKVDVVSWFVSLVRRSS